MMLSGVISAIKKLQDNDVMNHYGKTELHFEKKASPVQLKEIREKLQKENKIPTRNKALFITIFISLLIYFIGFY